MPGKVTGWGVAGASVLALAVGLGVVAWSAFHHDPPQPAWITADARNEFLYGSVGGEREAGVPYWIWLVLPRMFPDYLPGPGGYASLGLSWEQGREMPVGLSKAAVGYVRVAGNCALCHSTSYPVPSDAPTIVVADHADTGNVTRLVDFLARCAKDPRFNADEILGEIDLATRLSFLDRAFYRFSLIPHTRQLLGERRMILDTTLMSHARNPRSGAPASDPRMKRVEAWLRQSSAH